MALSPLIIAHMAPAVAALPLGAWVLWSRKGSAAHKAGGRIWVGLMFVTAFTSLWMTGLNGGWWSPIHILSLVVLFYLPVAIRQAMGGDIANHRRHMRNMYFGLLSGGLLAVWPSHSLGHLLWG